MRFETNFARCADVKANRIRSLGKQTVESVVEIGRLLTECKAEVGHGNWLPWLEREFGWSDSAALRFMQVYEMTSKSIKLTNLDLPLSSLYALAAAANAGVRDDVIQEVVKKASATGKPVKHMDVAKAIRDRKPSGATGPKPDRRTYRELEPEIVTLADRGMGVGRISKEKHFGGAVAFQRQTAILAVRSTVAVCILCASQCQ